jgi:hypothetical protein
MSGEQARQLSPEEIVELKLAARRQLARWAQKRELSPRQRVKRTALRRAVSTLEDTALVHGCELRVAGDQ